MIRSQQSVVDAAEFLGIPLRVSLNGIVLEATSALSRLTGYSAKELISQGPASLFKNALQPSEATASDCEIVRSDGNSVFCNYARLPMREGSEAEFFTSRVPLFDTDISSREQIFRDFAAAANDRFWEQDEQLRFTFITHPSESSDGAAAEFSAVSLLPECVGMTRWELAGADPATSPEWRQHKQELESRRPFKNFRYSYRHTDNVTRHWRVSGIPFFDENGSFRGYRGTASDETAEVEAQRAAQNAERRLRDAIESISEGFALFDSSDRLVQCNQRYREIFPEIADLLLPGIHFESALREAVDRGVFSIEGSEQEFIAKRLSSHRADGSPIILSLKDNRWVRVVERSTADGGVVGVWTDITELQRREQELLQAQKMEALGQLTGGIAHDFNNLLAVILGNLELLQSKPEADPQRQKFLDRCLTASRRAADLTGRLLAFSRRRHIETRRVQVNDAIRDLGELMNDCLPENIQLELALAEQLPLVVIEPNQLQTALLNLVLNARDAMPRGGTLSIATAVEQGATEQVVLRVRDTGTGIAPEIRARLFEPFFTTKTGSQGSGLGLSIVYGFVTQSGGTVEISSEVGAGTEIQMRLPAVPLEPESVSTAPAAAAEFSGEGRVVLVVEDEDAVRELVVSFLEELGFEVLEADNGESALIQIERRRDLSLVISDIVLSSPLNGAQLAKDCLRRYSGLRFLLMSGYAAYQEGASENQEQIPFLQKPFTHDQFTEAVAAALR